MSEETKAILATYTDPISEESTSQSTTPFIGQRFATHEAAYESYSRFAKRVGFSIRRHRTDGKDGVGRGLMRRYFVCHRAGNTPSKQPSPKPQRNRKSSRCGCQAYMRITKTSNPTNNLEWRITGFSNHHNHELLKPDQVKYLPAYRVISGFYKSRILAFSKSGISIPQMMRLLEIESCAGPGELNFTEKDVRNLIQSFKKEDEKEEDGESDDLVRVCEGMKERDGDLRFDCKRDCGGRVESIAWACNSSVELYGEFGDAVVFDTSRRLEGFNEMVFGVWVGVNNYGKPCLFGCVLLEEESLRSFTWALQVFLRFMNGKSPRTVLTDQNSCLREAIQNEMPNSKHAFCIWLIITKLPSWFNAILGDRFSDFETEFYQLYNSESEGEFEIRWREMVENYGIHSNRHILNLFALRSFWALPYLRNYFLAGLHAPGAAKLINEFIQQFLTSQTRLSHFIEQVTIPQNPSFQNQTLQTISFKTGSPIESHAALHLTPYAFAKLQDELVMAAHYAAFRTDESAFLVGHHTEGRTGSGRIVTWVPHREVLSCSCRMFEFTGILCRHVLRVLSTTNCFQIPDHYLPVRWRRAHTSEEPVQEDSDEVKELESMVSELVSEAAKDERVRKFVLEEVKGVLKRVRDKNGDVGFSS